MNPAKRSSIANYEGLLADVVDVLADARRAAARVVNATMTTTYWFIGRRIIEEDLLFFHRRLRCLVIIDLKLGKLNHADAYVSELCA